MTPSETLNQNTSQSQADIHIRSRRQVVNSCLKIAAIAIFLIACFLNIQPQISIRNAVLGFLTSIAFLVSIFPAYIICRAISWRFLRSKRKSEIAPKINTFNDAKKPSEYPGVQRIDAFQHNIVWQIPIYQGNARAALFTVAAIPALIIISVAIRSIIEPKNGFDVGLLFGEAFSLGALLWFVISDRGPTTKWLAGRTQAELLRREQYLCLAKLGVYKDQKKLDDSILARLTLLDTEDYNQLKKLISIKEFATIQPFPTTGTPTDIEPYVETYVKYRIQKQLTHMQWALDDVERASTQLTRTLAALAIFAFAAAVIHSILDYLPASPTINSLPGLQISRFIILISAIAPAIASFAVSINSLLKVEQLSRLYSWVISELREELNNAIQLKANLTNSADDFSNFQKLVLNVETTLTNELRAFLFFSEQRASVS
jgi:hypothetical protein